MRSSERQCRDSLFFVTSSPLQLVFSPHFACVLTAFRLCSHRLSLVFSLPFSAKTVPDLAVLPRGGHSSWRWLGMPSGRPRSSN